MALHAAVTELEHAVRQADGPHTARAAAAAWVVAAADDAENLLRAQEFAWFEEMMPLLGGLVPRKKKTSQAATIAFRSIIRDAIQAIHDEKPCSWHCSYTSSQKCFGPKSRCGNTCAMPALKPMPARATKRAAPSFFRCLLD